MDGEVTLILLPLLETASLIPNWTAARIIAALASPIPSTSMRSERLAFLREFKPLESLADLRDLKTLVAVSIAESPLLFPVLMIRARSSALER